MFNPDFPRPDLLKRFLEQISGRLGRWMPDMGAGFGALSMPSFSPSFQVGNAGGSREVNNYHFYRGITIVARDGESVDKMMRRLSTLQGIGVG